MWLGLRVLPRQKPIVRCVVDALEGKGWAKLIALSRVVVDDIEDHLETGIVKACDDLLKFA
jgi:hypothetical protein